MDTLFTTALIAFATALAAPVSEQTEQNAEACQKLLAAWNYLGTLNQACAESVNGEVDAWIEAHYPQL